jgi:peptidoglycan/LPS O-acetylase OafA/YrhL
MEAEMGKTGAPGVSAVLDRSDGSGRREPDDRAVGGPGATGAAARLPYNPAFDGIRGLAVAAVLLFHHGVTWMRGGYLGVSTFFTLSGFLITSLLLAEWTRSGSVRLAHFWARRVRRLLPASALTLLGIMLMAVAVDQPWERSLRGDVLAALFQVANWRFLFDDRSYSELFADPSPVLHFWSLAIEEQF